MNYKYIIVIITILQQNENNCIDLKKKTQSCCNIFGTVNLNNVKIGIVYLFYANVFQFNKTA